MSVRNKTKYHSFFKRSCSVHAVLFILIFNSVFSVSAGVANEVLIVKQINTAQGLPNSQVYDIVEDKQGYIWFATDRGLTRYNGEEFKVFNQFISPVFLKIIPHEENGIWAYNIDNSIIYISNTGEESVIETEAKGLSFRNFGVLPQGGFIVNARYSGAILDKEGKLIEEKDEFNNGRVIIFSHHESTILKVIFTESKELKQLDIDVVNYETNDTLFSEKIDAGLYGRNFGIERLDSTGFLINSGWSVFYKEGEQDCQEIFKVEDNRIVTAQQMQDSLILIGLKSDGALLYNLNSGQADTILTNCSVTSFYQDERGNIWVSTLLQGVFVISANENFISTENGVITEIAKTKNTIYASTSSQNVVAFNENDIQVVYTDKVNYPRVYGLNDTLVLISGDTGVITCEGDVLSGGVDLYTINALSYKDDSLTLLKRFSIFSGKIENGKATVSFRRSVDSFLECVFAEDDRTLYGGRNGLYVEVSDTAEMDIFLEGTRIIDIDKYNDYYFISTRGKGVLILNKVLTIIGQISSVNGLSSNQVSKSIIWKDYLWVANRKDIQMFDLTDLTKLNISLRHSFYETEIVDFLIDDDTLYAATPSAIHVVPVENAVKRSALLDKGKLLNVNLNVLDAPEDNPPNLMRLDHGFNNIHVNWDFISSPFSESPLFRFRLINNRITQPWVYTSDHQAAFYNLEPGNYEFILSRKRNNNMWEQLYSEGFTINIPWWRTKEFILLIILFFIFLSVVISRRIIRSKGAKKDVEFRIESLKNKALRAQMNPHFIFNALNSVQRHISEGDMNTASVYLSRFAALIRLILENSEKTYLTYSEELQLVQQYLQIEKTRFRDKLNYSIDTRFVTDADLLLLPAFSIQPIVENAIKHGISKMTTSGDIYIDITEDEEFVRCTIINSGPGFVDNLQNLLQKESSFGIRGVHERIKSLNSRCGISEIESDENSTKIVLLLPKIRIR